MSISIPSQIQMSFYYVLLYFVLDPYTGGEVNIAVSLVGSLAFYGISKLIKLKVKETPSLIKQDKATISQVSDLNIFDENSRILEFDMDGNEMEVLV